ncbi:MAG TPA: methyltransferase domain-containing protein [Actinomycetes bacterium]|nr:methyltransferase domain-containing protein [Actinomycetes bacterium]
MDSIVDPVAAQTDPSAAPPEPSAALPEPSAAQADPTEALTERLLQAQLGAFELYALYLGERLGLYRALADDGPATSTELAARTGTVERYVREWLEHQAVSGWLIVDNVAAGPLDRRYTLPPEYIPVLVDQEDVRYAGYVGVDIVRSGRPLPQLVEAFRHGGAPPRQPWEPEGRAEFNRALFRNLLGNQWLPSIPAVDRRLRSSPPARVADLACGSGWSSIAMAVAYPEITVTGLDLDRDVIERANRNAGTEGVGDRVEFLVADATDPGLAGRFDLVTIFEALHDMPRPVEALSAARALLTSSGSVVIADERAEDEFAAPGTPRDRHNYGWSLVSCLPAVMGDPQTAATGAVLRPAAVRRFASAAGFGTVEILPIDTDFWWFYRLLP